MLEYVKRELHDKKSTQNQQDFLRELENHITCLPHGCTIAGSEKCSACKGACERQKSLFEYVQDRPHETETQSLITKYTEVVRQSTIRILSQSFDALAMQQDCFVDFDNIITAYLKKHLSTTIAGGFSDRKRSDIIDEIFAALLRTAKDHDKPVRNKIAEAILYDYRQHADMLYRFNSSIGRFEDIFARKLGTWKQYKYLLNRKPRENDIEYLKSMIDSLLRQMLEERQAEYYEDGMVAELSHRLAGRLDSIQQLLFTTHKLLSEEKLNIHVWTMQQFCKRMEDMQAVWDKKNKSSVSVLNENKERYVQIINTRLQHGFTCAAEGQIIGQHLLKVTQQKAITAENMEKIQTVGSLVWTTNSQKVRLKYFKHLAEQVKDGQTDAALAHFLSPAKQIESWYWYKATVDEYRSELFGKTFARTFEQEFTAVLRKVENAEDSDEILSVTKEYASGVEYLHYQLSSNFSYASNTNELKVMKAVIPITMKENKVKFCTFDDKLLSLPSTDAGVMSRLGCTATCYWCGALCWGQRGHETDEGETRKHYSAHQPKGLSRTRYVGTNHLVSRPCHEERDETIVSFGEYTGIPWQKAKENHFSDWSFDKHHISKFDELMRWFFQELHYSIATDSESLKPAIAEDLERYNCTNLSYDDIMSHVEQEIN